MESAEEVLGVVVVAVFVFVFVLTSTSAEPNECNGLKRAYENEADEDADDGWPIEWRP